MVAVIVSAGHAVPTTPVILLRLWQVWQPAETAAQGSYGHTVSWEPAHCFFNAIISGTQKGRSETAAGEEQRIVHQDYTVLCSELFKSSLQKLFTDSVFHEEQVIEVDHWNVILVLLIPLHITRLIYVLLFVEELWGGGGGGDAV